MMTEQEYYALAVGKKSGVEGKLTIDLDRLTRQTVEQIFSFLSSTQGQLPAGIYEMLTTAAGKYYLDAVLPEVQKAGTLNFLAEKQPCLLGVQEFRKKALAVFATSKIVSATAAESYANVRTV